MQKKNGKYGRFRSRRLTSSLPRSKIQAAEAADWLGIQALFTSSDRQNPEGKVQKFRRSMRNFQKLKIASIKQLMIKTIFEIHLKSLASNSNCLET